MLGLRARAIIESKPLREPDSVVNVFLQQRSLERGNSVFASVARSLARLCTSERASSACVWPRVSARDISPIAFALLHCSSRAHLHGNRNVAWAIHGSMTPARPVRSPLRPLRSVSDRSRRILFTGMISACVCVRYA